jgi:hypothetical protein
MGNENFKLEYWISYLLFILVVLYKTQRNNVNHFILFVFFKDTKYFVNNVTVDAENVPPPQVSAKKNVPRIRFRYTEY